MVFWVHELLLILSRLNYSSGAHRKWQPRFEFCCTKLVTIKNIIQCFSFVTTLFIILNKKEEKFIEQMNAIKVSTPSLYWSQCHVVNISWVWRACWIYRYNGMKCCQCGDVSIGVSDKTLFCYWGVSLLGVHFRVFLCLPLESWLD